MNIVMPDNLTNARSGIPNKAAILPYNPGPSALSAESNFFQASFPLLFTPIGPSSTTPNNAVTSAGSEAIILSFGRTLAAVQVAGTFVATVTVEATLDNLNWVKLTDITTAGITQYSGVYYAYRVKISAYTSGNPFVTFLMQR